MASANLGRRFRHDKVYSRARDRADLIRTVDEEFHGDFEFPIVQPDVVEGEASLAQLMEHVNAEDEDPTPS